MQNEWKDYVVWDNLWPFPDNAKYFPFDPLLKLSQDIKKNEEEIFPFSRSEVLSGWINDISKNLKKSWNVSMVPKLFEITSYWIVSFELLDVLKRMKVKAMYQLKLMTGTRLVAMFLIGSSSGSSKMNSIWCDNKRKRRWSSYSRLITFVRWSFVLLGIIVTERRINENMYSRHDFLHFPLFFPIQKHWLSFSSSFYGT